MHEIANQISKVTFRDVTRLSILEREDYFSRQKALSATKDTRAKMKRNIKNNITTNLHFINFFI